MPRRPACWPRPVATSAPGSSTSRPTTCSTARGATPVSRGRSGRAAQRLRAHEARRRGAVRAALPGRADRAHRLGLRPRAQLRADHAGGSGAQAARGGPRRSASSTTSGARRPTRTTWPRRSSRLVEAGGTGTYHVANAGSPRGGIWRERRSTPGDTPSCRSRGCVRRISRARRRVPPGPCSIPAGPSGRACRCDPGARPSRHTSTPMPRRCASWEHPRERKVVATHPRHRWRRLPRLAPVRAPPRRRLRGDLLRQPPDGADGQHPAAARPPDASRSSTTTSPTTSTSRVRSTRAPLRLAGQPGRFRAPSDRDPEGRLARHAPRARPRQGEGRAAPARQHVGVLRRSRSESAARELLGPRQSDRHPRRLRRGQALRRGDDDGLPPPPRRRRPHRPHLQHLRPAHAAPRRPRDPELHDPGDPRRADHGVRRRLARRARSATWTTSSRASCACCAATTSAR